MVARRHDGNVGFDEFFAAGAAFQHAMAALVEVSSKAIMSPTKLGSFAVVD